MKTEARIIIIGAGAAGLMAALTVAGHGIPVLLIERNRRIGRKLLISGGGRCNLTNQVDLAELITNIPGNGKFLHSAFWWFGPAELIAFIENELGIPTKVERGRRVFPVSDRASDIVTAFDRALVTAGVARLPETRVKQLVLENGCVIGVACEDGRVLTGSAIIVATGGLAYPGTGSSGDGLHWARQIGLDVVAPFPSLVPLETEEEYPARLEGLSLINVRVDACQAGRKIASEFGEMLFTGSGVSGPTILTLSRSIVPRLGPGQPPITLAIDLKSALSETELDARIQRDFSAFSRKLFKNALDELLPQKLIPVFIDCSGIDPVKPVHQITRNERQCLLRLFKAFTLTIRCAGSYQEAIVTGGGVSVKELDPRTMECKRFPGLYFAGEVVDVDGYTGGFNLQIAFSMGRAAGEAAAERLAGSP
jgi:predicted Rossmann fold flavoprotein